MTSIVELFPKCRKLSYDARQQLAMIQQQGSRGGGSSSSGSGGGGGSISELYIVLEELSRQLDCMDEIVLRETPEQRNVWKRKILELRQECNTLQQQGHAAEMMIRKTSYQSDREELLRRRRRNGTSNNNNIGNSNSNSNNNNGFNGGESDLHNLADESASLEQSHFMVTDIINQGQASLSDLIAQRQRLTGATRVVAEIGSRLGLTQTTMKIIERRDITDAYLVVVGMMVTLIVIYLAWF